MIKVLAQMKRLRPAPGTQGVLKRINIEQRYNYCNYMSKAKVKKIRDSWKKELEKSDLDPEVRAKISKKKEIYERTLVKSRTYLTPDWSEMVPFPSSK